MIPPQCQATDPTDREACHGRPACPGCIETVAARLEACDTVLASIALPPAPALVDPRELIGPDDVLRTCGWKTRKSIGDQRDFPAPVAVVSGMRLWTRTDVERWAARRP